MPHRMHTTKYRSRDGSRWEVHEKMPFATEADARRAIDGLIADNAAVRANRHAPLGYNAYQCAVCAHWHVGRNGKRVEWKQLNAEQRKLRHMRLKLYWTIYRYTREKEKTDEGLS